MLSSLLIADDKKPQLLKAGNSKLGESIHVWSIPAVVTCPGSSEICRDRCYATKGFFLMNNVKAALFKNLALCASPFFVDWMINSIKRRKATILRIHAAGDFMSVAYLRSWLHIVRACPETTFYAYTRSWRIPEMRKLLPVLAAQPNFQLWYSCDIETGSPELLPEESKIRLAYMTVRVDDIPDKPADIVFRDYPTRGVVQKHLYGDMVCPPENGTGAKINCEKCRICFSDPMKEPNKRSTGRFGKFERPTQRIPLQLVLQC